MALVALLILTLMDGGYWLGGREATVQVRWSVDDPKAHDGLDGAVLAWELSAAEAVLVHGRVDFQQADPATTLRIAVPAVRVPAEMRLTYRLLGKQGAELDRGERAIHVFPPEVLQGAASGVKADDLAVWDGPDGLPAALKKAGVPHTVIDGLGKLQFRRPAIVLVGAGQLKTTPAAQVRLMGLAEAGSSVFIFRQRVNVLMDYGVVPRRPSDTLRWRMDHPLLAGMDDAAVAALATRAGSEAPAVRLPADEPAYEIAFWPREAPGEEPVPIDALLAVRRVGKGRLVLCQLPLSDGADDALSLLLLRNALDYLVRPAEPTPPPSQRPDAPTAEAPDVSTIRIPAGVEP